MPRRDWRVLRQTDGGRPVILAAALTEAEARLLSISYAARGGARYWIEPMSGAFT